jgi:endonuclease YncB( thermonuclease family)
MRQAIVFDTETLGLERSAMHEASFFDVDTKTVHEYIMRAHVLYVDSAVDQDSARLATSPLDAHSRQNFDTWKPALNRHMEVLGAKTSGNVLEDMKTHMPFTYKQIRDGNAPHLLGKETVAQLETRVAKFKAKGVIANLGNVVRVEDFVSQILPTHLKSKKILWIANAAFEAKQVGSQAAASAAQGLQVDLVSGLETQTRGVDPYYVTGAKVNSARLGARLSGDWRPVYEEYLKPHEGLAVRDILDVERANYSYARSLGLYKGPDVGLSVDTQTRIWNAIEPGSFDRESHRAAEDAATHEAPLLARHLDMADVLRAADNKTPEGLRYIEQARAKSGPLYRAATFFGAVDANLPAIERQGAGQRLARAQRDILATGKSVQTSGISNLFDETQDTPSSETTMRRANWRRVDENLEQVGRRIGGVGPSMVSEVAGLDRAGTEAFEAGLEWTVKGARSIKNAPSALPPLRGALGVAAGVVAGLGLIGAVGGGGRTEPPGNIVSYGYEQWLNSQEGMASQGWAKDNRKQNTDFGSPYRGPVASSQVLFDQERLAEREKWLRSQYGARHYDPVSGLFGLESVFKFSRGGYSYIQGGSPVAAMQGLRGDNLMAINLNDGGWKITAPDADTITLKRGGVRGGVASFFGLNSGYSFRLAGIDAPETAHGNNPAQPGAEAAASGFRSMLGGNMELVFDPNQVTYGRQVGVLFADGKNLNVEALKRGYAAHLPYGSNRDALLDYPALAKAEKKVVDSQRGIYSTPWAQAIYAASDAGGERLTMNSLARKERLVQNAGAMSMVAYAEQVQEQGSFGPEQNRIAREIGSSVTLRGSDEVGPSFFFSPNAPHKTYLSEQLQDISTFTKTHGTGYSPNKFSRRSGYGTLDSWLAVDTMGSSNSPWTRKRYEAYDLYETQKGINQRRKAQMAEQQRAVNSVMFQSGIGHHRM